MSIKDQATQQNVPFEIVPISLTEFASVRGSFDFDWGQEMENEVFGLQTKPQSQIIGLMSLVNHPSELRIEIALLECSKDNIGKTKQYEGIAGCMIAYACRLSFQRGYFGFVSLISKTQLIAHYIQVYGFKQYGRHLAIDLEDANRLIEKYLNYEEGS